MIQVLPTTAIRDHVWRWSLDSLRCEDYISAVDDSNPSPGESQSTALMNHPRRILVADDEPTIRFLLEKILTAKGYQVTTVANGDDALRISATHVFELFLIDLIMPGKDGIETILTLRAKRKNTPILAISGGWNEGASSCLPLAGKLGACGTLAKPFDRATLLEAVRREIAK